MAGQGVVQVHHHALVVHGQDAAGGNILGIDAGDAGDHAPGIETAGLGFHPAAMDGPREELPALKAQDVGRLERRHGRAGLVVEGYGRPLGAAQEGLLEAPGEEVVAELDPAGEETFGMGRLGAFPAQGKLQCGQTGVFDDLHGASLPS